MMIVCCIQIILIIEKSMKLRPFNDLWIVIYQSWSYNFFFSSFFLLISLNLVLNLASCLYKFSRFSFSIYALSISKAAKLV